MSADKTTIQIDAMAFDPAALSAKALNAIRASVGVLGVVSLAIGIALIAWPGKTLVVLAALTGAYFLLAGVVRVGLGVFSREVSAGYRTLTIILGLVLVLGGVVALKNLTAATAVLTLIVVVLVGVGWIIEGVVALVAAGRGAASKWAYALGVFSIIAGIVVIAVPAWSAVAFVIVAGVFFVLLGLLAVIQAFTLGKDAR
jgi:uncharacterized membrane protein HdeD (DUF308 family)